ncbi:hypothetical protein LCGC14_0755170 [marine sediment metagenome]|uniref:Uncharacterized protein n=1 Tax=marine sediment metagenome TaxID=412755 RepID=A0A0F9T9Y0_9ZZZZ
MPRQVCDTKTFIQKAQAKHGDRYDYSRVVYRGGNTEVAIGCEEHKFFMQKPVNHLQGHGCHLCTLATSKASADRFIRKAKVKHGDHYGYELVEYKGPNHKVVIVCTVPGHGPFAQLASGHLAGKEGCPDCRRSAARDRLQKPQGQVIEEFRAVHGARYNYDQVQYTGTHNHVLIECDTHGVFSQVSGHHRKGHGCPVCGNERTKKATKGTKRKMPKWDLKSRGEHFVERAIELHGDQYGYGFVVYNKATEPVILVCSEHNLFEQMPTIHLQGSGCPACGDLRGKGKRWSTEDFVAKARQAHGDRYDYSQVDYKHNNTKVWLVCTLHGRYFQTPRAHLDGQHCPKCSSISGAKKSRVTKEGFLAQAKRVHGNKYKYLEWSGRAEKVLIECPAHGKFKMAHDLHLQGRGCPRCSFARTGKDARYSTAEFVELAIEKHGDKYDYSEVDYQTNEQPVTLYCPQHGSFDQRAGNHLKGHGCPACNASKGETEVARWLNDYNVTYVQQWTDHDCIAIERKARFDFYITDHKVLIEYDGKQHHEALPNMCGSPQTPKEAAITLKKIQTSDRNKNAWAKANNIMMIRIRYDEDVAKALNQRLLPLIENSF